MDNISKCQISCFIITFIKFPVYLRDVNYEIYFNLIWSIDEILISCDTR